MKMHVTDNELIKQKIREALRKNDGYCPCVFNSKGKKEYLCPCEEFFEEIQPGHNCHCGLYIKDEM